MHREKEVEIDLDNLRNVLEVSSYPRWADFNRYIIENATEEINECADDIHIEYEPLREGRRIKKILFIITSARAKQIMSSHKKMKARLDNNPLYKK